MILGGEGGFSSYQISSSSFDVSTIEFTKNHKIVDHKLMRFLNTPRCHSWKAMQLLEHIGLVERGFLILLTLLTLIPSRLLTLKLSHPLLLLLPNTTLIASLRYKSFSSFIAGDCRFSTISGRYSYRCLPIPLVFHFCSWSAHSLHWFQFCKLNF